MQNKPNFRNVQMNVTSISTKAYENNRPFGQQKNKPKQTQFPECPPDVQIAVSLVKTRNYNNEQRTTNFQNKPNQSQYKPNTNPICRMSAGCPDGCNLSK